MGRRTEERAPELAGQSDRRRRRRPRPWYRSRRVRRRIKRVAFWLLVAVGVLLLACAVSAAIVGPSMWRAAGEGRETLLEASAAVVRRDAKSARVEFLAAQELFGTAREKIDSPVAWPLRVVPVVSTHAGTGRSLARIGEQISEAGVAIADAMDGLPDESLVFRDGRVDLGHVRDARDALRNAMRVAPEIEDAIEDMPSGWVGGPFALPRSQARDLLPKILAGVRKADAALDGLPSILAEGGQKRYLVAFSNLSELRGSGGLFGYVTALRATDGDLDLDELSGRPTEIFPPPLEAGLEFPDWFPDDFRSQAGIFQNINMTTDFPTVGSLVLRTAEAGDGQFDGVIAVDPVGIGAILGLTGPITVPSWPRAISSENVAKIAMHDVYVEISENNAREVFFEQLVRTAFDRLVSSTIRLSPQSAGAFDRAVAGAHFRMFSEHDRDQEVFDRLGASGTLQRAANATDVLSVVSQNATGNKGDWFLRRDVRYTVRLDPGTNEASTTLQATFRNTAPSVGLPDYVIGSAVDGLARGTNRQIVVLVRAPTDELGRLTVDDGPATAVDEPEGDLRSYRSTVEVPARSSSRLTVTSNVPGALTGSGGERVYRLHVLRQAVANPDFAEIEVEVPAGWVASGQTRFLGDLTEDVILEVRLNRTLRATVVDTLFVKPWRFLAGLFGTV